MLKVALVGVGGISGAHIPAWESMDDAELVAICDIRPERMENYPDKRHYTDFDEMLETECIILNYSSNTELDMSAIFALEDIIVRLKSQKIQLILVIPNQKVYEQIKSLEIVSQIGQEAIYTDEKDAINKAVAEYID